MGWRGPMYKSHVLLYEAEGSIGSMDKQSLKKNHHEDKETNMITGVRACLKSQITSGLQQFRHHYDTSLLL